MIIREKNNVVFPVCTDFVTVTDFITEYFCLLYFQKKEILKV